ncbi:diacylglycerol kinase family lipid kinase [Fulvivirgaceae bacterium BMA10]|uniref:Diacylglycerol kinase family lipid kinase n=1 Tax=Splendidivirga corallicola TaxID=3051826 RepID=A0ABT8KMZ2_9BACT|nr:diacylglycerol kinase family lipid kinase [Fulvivirgaceae bacterium BMA10]
MIEGDHQIFERDKWYVIVNPEAAGGKAGKQWETISGKLSTYGIDFFFRFTTHRGHAIQLAVDGLKKGCSKFIAVGGDGTLNEVINGLLRNEDEIANDTTVGIIPLGTGNDWIKTHGIKDIDHAIEMIAHGKTVKHDIGYVEYNESSGIEKRYFINVAGFCFDAAVVKQVEYARDKGNKGKFAYIQALIQTLFKYASDELKVIFNGKEISGRIFNISVGICNFNGGGMKIAPLAKFNDGLLDITLVKKIAKIKIIFNFMRLFDGSFIKLREVMAERTQEILIESKKSIYFEVDGEFIAKTNFAKMNLVKGVINTITGLDQSS